MITAGVDADRYARRAAKRRRHAAGREIHKIPAGRPSTKGSAGWYETAAGRRPVCGQPLRTKGLAIPDAKADMPLVFPRSRD
jgi:hypothetical protein